MNVVHAWQRGTALADRLLPTGWLRPEPAPDRPADVWVHAASAGEVRAAAAVRARAGEGSWLVTTQTAAGLASGADARAPRDTPAEVARAFDVLQPRAVLLVEAELWPNLLVEAARRGIPVGVVGARLSRRSAVRWARSGGKELLASVAGFAAASDGDAERLLALGVSPERVAVTGWIKWPAAPQAPTAEDLALVEEIEGDGPLVVLGSVHPGEVGRAAVALAEGPLAPERARWLVVPRHARAEDAIAREARRALGAARRWTLDRRFGRLPALWSLADAAVVGGGTAKGTHNLLEPLQGGLRPRYFDDLPSDVGAALTDAGCAVPLSSLSYPETPLTAALPWDDVLERWDGRRRALDFLAGQGLPLGRAS